MNNRTPTGLGCAVAALALVSTLEAAHHDPFSKKLGKDQKIEHALRRLTFGARPGDAARVRQQGLDRWIERQLHPEQIGEDPLLEEKLRPLETVDMDAASMVRKYPPPRVARAAGGNPPPAGAGMAGPLGEDALRALRTAPPEEKARLLMALPEPSRERALELLPGPQRRQVYSFLPTPFQRRVLASSAPQQVVAEDLSEAKLYRALYSNRQLEELLVDFWYNHFNVFLDKGADRYLVTEYEREAIRPHVLGKFEDLLLATARSPAMLFYLDNWQSVAPGAARGRRGLNENYGRELLELHTLGVDGGYAQKDVVEVARCFTGWTIRAPQLGGEFFFNEKLHDRGEKTVLGVTIPAGGGIEDGEKVIALLAHHPSTARFLSRELAVRFVADDPPPALVERMARTFLKTGGDLREVMRTMLRSREFFSQGAWRAKVRSPLETVAAAARALDAQVDTAVPLAGYLARLGEPLYRKLEPTGYSNSNADWVNSAALLGRMNFAVALANNRIPGVKVKVEEGAALLVGGPEFQRK